MELTFKQRTVNLLRAQGFNPIHLFGDVYLVRHESIIYSKIPFYKIKIIKD
jgi:hypothetical protein